MSRQGGGEGGEPRVLTAALDTGIAEVETREVHMWYQEKVGDNWGKLEKDGSRRLHCWGKFVGPYSGRSGGRTTLKPGKQSRSPNRNISDTTTK